jgi:Holliday junction resolvase
MDGVKAIVTKGLEAGCPDILGCCHQGQFFCIECKIGSNEPTRIQKHRLKEWSEAGAVCIVAREDFDKSKFLEAMDKNT